MSQSSGEVPGSGLARSFRGYDPAAVERMLRDLTARCESAERERDETKKRLADVETDAAESRELERTLRNTLVIAQRSADELKEQSRLEAAETLQNAQVEARGIVGEAERRADLLRAEITLLEERERETRKRFSELLRSTLAQLEGGPDAAATTASGNIVDDLRPSADRPEPAEQAS